MSTSIGFQSPISGNLGRDVPRGNYLGKGIRGYIPQGLITSDKDDNFAMERFTLREAWNTKYQSELAGAHKKRIVTPFRAVNNAGDLLCRKDYSCGGSCQTSQSRPNMHGLSSRFGAIQSRCDGSGVQPSACNQKYVYDGSDYITYKKQSAVLKNYNSLNFGGDDYHSTQSVIRAIHRY